MSTTAKIRKLKKIANNHDVYQSLINLKHTLSDALADNADGVKTRATEMLNNLIEDFQDRKNEYQEDLEEYVAKKPYRSLGVALIAGFLLGKVISK